MVDRVEALVAARPCRPAGRCRHQSQGGPHARQSMLLGPVVEGVPAQVLGVSALGMTPGHGDEQGADLAAAGSEDTVDLVGRGTGKRHCGPSGMRDFGMACLDHAPEALSPGHFRPAEYLVHARHVRPQRCVRFGCVLEDRLDADELAHVRAVVLDADGLTARPVHDDRGSVGDLHRPDAELDVVVFKDRVVVVRFVGMEP